MTRFRSGSPRPRPALVLLILAVAGRLSAQGGPMTLQQSIAIAQRDGHGGKEAAANLAASEARDRVFYARLRPLVSLSTTLPSYNSAIVQVTQPDGTIRYVSQNQTDARLAATVTQRLPFSGGDLSVTTSLGRLAMSGTQNRELWNTAPVSIRLSQNIFQPNNVKWDRRERGVSGDIAERNYLESREEVAVETTNLFFDAYVASLTLKNVIATSAINDTLLARNEARYAFGKIGENDKEASKLQALRARAAVEQARLDYDRSLAAFRLGLGLPPGAPVELTMSLQVPGFDVDTARAVEEARKNGVTPLTVELRQLQAERAINAAKLTNGIAASVTAGFGFNGSGDGFHSAYEQPQRSQQFTLGISAPVLQYGARTNAVRAAEADRVFSEENSKFVMAQAAQDAHFTALQLGLARRNLAIAAQADTAAGRYFEVQYSLYGNGKITIDQLYLAQQGKDLAFTSFMQALRLYWQTYYKLRRITLFDFEAGQPIR